MRKNMCIFMIIALLCGLLAACAEGENGASSAGNSTPSVNVDFSKNDDDMFTDRDQKDEENVDLGTTGDGETDAPLEGGADGSIHIRLEGDSARASSDSVKIEGTKVTITENATHVISGTLNDGMLIVDAEDTAKLQVVFNGVQITSATSAAMYILEADKVFLTLAEGTKNSLANGGTFTAIDENNIDGALFSKQDLTLNGAGALTVTSPVGHGIVCKDDLVITGGSYTVASASHALDVNDSVRITGETTLSLDAGKDGIHCENDEDTEKGFVYISGGQVNVEAEGDGISAGAYVQVEAGTVRVTAGGGSENGSQQSSGSFGGFMGGGRPGQSSADSSDDGTSMKGIKAENSILLSGGAFTIDSADDSIHSNVSIVINGGTFEIASGDDAIHAEETLNITAGTIQISESYEGLEALHIQIQGGDIGLKASDDGLNAAGGTDSSGLGGRDEMFGGGGGRPGGPGGHGGMGGGMSGSSDGSIIISGGNLYVNASGDGLDANGTLEISGGYTVVVGPTQGDTATLDYDVSGVITGGTFIGTGASGMAQTFSNSQQGVIALRVGNQSAGTTITLKDKDGNTVIEYAPELSFAVVILSSPDIVSGQTYSISVGTASGEFAAS